MDSNLDEYNTFYQLLNPRHQLVAQVGEESHEDSLKIKSVLKNPKSQMLILRCFGIEYRVSSKT